MNYSNVKSPDSSNSQVSARMSKIYEKVDEFITNYSSTSGNLRVELSGYEKNLLEEHLNSSESGKRFDVRIGLFKPTSIIKTYIVQVRPEYQELYL